MVLLYKCHADWPISKSLKNWGLHYAGRSSKEFMVEWNMYSIKLLLNIIIYIFARDNKVYYPMSS